MANEPNRTLEEVDQAVIDLERRVSELETLLAEFRSKGFTTEREVVGAIRDLGEEGVTIDGIPPTNLKK